MKQGARMVLLIGFVLVLGSVALDGWATHGVLASRADLSTKLWWMLSILLCPLIGALVWFLAGPKGEDISNRFR